MDCTKNHSTCTRLPWTEAVALESLLQVVCMAIRENQNISLVTLSSKHVLTKYKISITTYLSTDSRGEGTVVLRPTANLGPCGKKY